MHFFCTSTETDRELNKSYFQDIKELIAKRLDRVGTEQVQRFILNGERSELNLNSRVVRYLENNETGHSHFFQYLKTFKQLKCDVEKVEKELDTIRKYKEVRYQNFQKLIAYHPKNLVDEARKTIEGQEFFTRYEQEFENDSEGVFFDPIRYDRFEALEMDPEN